MFHLKVECFIRQLLVSLHPFFKINHRSILAITYTIILSVNAFHQKKAFKIKIMLTKCKLRPELHATMSRRG